MSKPASQPLARRSCQTLDASTPMPTRHEYRLPLDNWHGRLSHAASLGFQLRGLRTADEGDLAVLMLEAYRGTIDYEQETEAEAREEVRSFLSGSAGMEPLLEQSVALTKGPLLASACLIKHWPRRGFPLVGYVITHPMFKRRGLAKTALGESLSRLRVGGHSEVRAVITEGNLASERLFSRAGFTMVAS